MPTYRELLQQVRAEIAEVDAARARELVDAGEAVVVDVREQAEWDEGHIPGAVHVPRGHLESRIERAVPDTAQPVVLSGDGDGIVDASDLAILRAGFFQPPGPSGVPNDCDAD